MISVSIIVPVYNTENYLKKCLNSLINQTLKNIEIIVVNDGSTDNSQKIIDEYVEKYSSVKSYQKQNGGLSDSRNFGLKYATGEFVGFVDSDDYIDPTMFEKMYNKAKENNSDLVECNFVWEYPNKLENDIGVKYSQKEDYFLCGRVMACNKLIKTSLIKENNISFPIGLRYEDIEFFYKLVPFVKKHDLVEDVLYHYVQRQDSIINYQNEKTADIFNILNNVFDFYESNNLLKEYNQELEYLYIRFLMGSSFLRITKIKNKDLRHTLLNKSFNELNTKFPHWKKNKLLNIKNKKNIYYKSINKLTYKIYSFIFKYN